MSFLQNQHRSNCILSNHIEQNLSTCLSKQTISTCLNIICTFSLFNDSCMCITLLLLIDHNINTCNFIYVLCYPAYDRSVVSLAILTWYNSVFNLSLYFFHIFFGRYILTDAKRGNTCVST